ncbi:hypothetical protein SAMN04487957_11091 [Halomonas shengliensis]|uniref:Uncharacterized protein n=1 Tax=Halomonas shengliensis TaxID=419597 RepID=A0A1H0LST8_9GAMM|nr:hypothetical protein [Halomonas shengliensis]SDO71194.1 hypothetical protein SAMN04487957_11091 [Halomonas shengliensis]
MIHTHTLVVRYPEGEWPAYRADTKINGGELVAVDFDGNRLRVCQQLEEALESIERIAVDGSATGHNRMVIAEKARAALELAQGISRGEMTA